MGGACAPVCGWRTMSAECSAARDCSTPLSQAPCHSASNLTSVVASRLYWRTMRLLSLADSSALCLANLHAHLFRLFLHACWLCGGP